MVHGRATGRCDVVAFGSADGLMRCTLDQRHYSLRHAAFGFSFGHVYAEQCAFDPSGDQEVCGRRSVNFSMRTIRICGRIDGHDDDCIYFWFTEREATREEMRLPVLEGQ